MRFGLTFLAQILLFGGLALATDTHKATTTFTGSVVLAVHHGADDKIDAVRVILRKTHRHQSRIEFPGGLPGQAFCVDDPTRTDCRTQLECSKKKKSEDCVAWSLERTRIHFVGPGTEFTTEDLHDVPSVASVHGDNASEEMGQLSNYLWDGIDTWQDRVEAFLLLAGGKLEAGKTYKAKRCKCDAVKKTKSVQGNCSDELFDIAEQFVWKFDAAAIVLADPDGDDSLVIPVTSDTNLSISNDWVRREDDMAELIDVALHYGAYYDVTEKFWNPVKDRICPMRIGVPSIDDAFCPPTQLVKKP